MVKIPQYFEEEAYVFYNPDIAAAVSAGTLASGYHHWLYAGHRELRAGSPYARAVSRKVFRRDFEKRQYGVNLYGFLSAPSGLGEVARSCRSALLESVCPSHEQEVPLWSRPDAPRVAPAERYRINLLVQNTDMMPLFVRAYGEEVLHGAYNIGFWFWELPSARSDTFHHYDYVDEIWVASEFCRRAFACLTRLPVVRMPLVIEGLEKRATHGREHFGLPERTFAFGYVYDVNSYLERKNPVALIEAFRREFGSSADVLLVLKQSHGGGPPHPGADTIARAAGGAANIRVIDSDFDEQEIASFHNVLDCFVSPHRSEGFGFNLAESMYLGKPVIATAYSGNVDFMDERNSYPLDYRLVTITETAGPYSRGAVWAHPDVTHLGRLMRSVYENADERKRRGAAAAATVRERFSAAEAARRIEERFRTLGLDEPGVSRSLFSCHASRWAPPFLNPATPVEVREQIRGLDARPVISVVAASEEQIESVRAQWYPYWELCVCEGGAEYAGSDARIKLTGGGTAAAAEMSTGEFICVLSRPIGPGCLLRVAKAFSPCDVDVFYVDADGNEAGSGERAGVVIRKLPFYGGPGGVFESLLRSSNPDRFSGK
jgi:glycosyltransferase involved in cell wall biosynthesis